MGALPVGSTGPGPCHFGQQRRVVVAAGRHVVRRGLYLPPVPVARCQPGAGHLVTTVGGGTGDCSPGGRSCRGAAAAPGLRLELLPVLTFVLAGALVAAALFRRAPLLGSLIGRTLRGAERFLPPSVCRHLRSAQVALRQMNNFNPPPRLWLACFGVAALNWMLDSVVLIMGLLTVGAPVPWKGHPDFLCRGPDPGGAADYAWWSGLGRGWSGRGADQVPRPGVAGHGGHAGVPRRQLLAIALGGLVGRALLDAAQPPGQSELRPRRPPGPPERASCEGS